MKNLFILFATLTLFYSCKKEDKKPSQIEAPKQFSYWTVDGQEYSSNNVTASLGKDCAFLSCRDKERFDFVFYSFSYQYSNFLPDSGSFLLTQRNREHNPSKVTLYIYFDTISYVPSINENKYLKAERINGKVRYTLPEMWYVKNNNPNDSIKVKGIFNEP